MAAVGVWSQARTPTQRARCSGVLGRNAGQLARRKFAHRHRRLHLGVLRQALWAELAADAGLFEPAERRTGVELVHVDSVSAGADFGGDLQSAGDVNATLFTATRCSETAFPWNPAAAADVRRQQAGAALQRVPADAFAPFDRSVAFGQNVIGLCSGWPDAPLPSPALGPLPAVPTLVLDGSADLRTPVEQAQRVAAAIPGARVVAVPNTGHSVLGSDLSGCVDDEIAAFADSRTPACTPTATPIAPTPRPPLRLGALAGGTPALRTVSAVRATLNDVRRQLIGDAIASGRSVTTGSRTGGLRGGVATVQDAGVVVLRRVSYVPGVRV